MLVRVTVVGYRDHGDRRRFEVKPFTTDIQSVKDFIGQLYAEGGGDAPEDVVGGLKLLTMQEWTKKAYKRVIMICDAPPHGLEYHDKKYRDDYPEGSPDGLKLEPLIYDLKKKRIHLSCMKLNKSVKPMLKIIKEIHDKC